MRRTSKYFFVGISLVIVYWLIFLSVSYAINGGENQLATIYVTQVSSGPNFQNPGGESFWSSIPATNVPLIAANSYPGTPSGYTDHVSVKMAWTPSGGGLLMIRMEFPPYKTVSSTPPSLGVPVVNDSSHSQLVPMYNSSCIYPYESCYGGTYPQNVGFLPLAIGPSYVYPEQAIVMLGMHPGANTDGWYQVSYKPKMVLGTSGALGTGSGGDAELWIWSRSPTDNSSSAYPGIKFLNGTNVDPSMFGMPPHASYAIDGYTNATSFYQLGGIPPSSQFPFINNAQLYTTNLSSVSVPVSQLTNPFEVQAKGQTPSAQTNNDWVVEFVRPLQTSTANGENNYQLQMNTSSSQNYHIAFAVSQEAASQTYLIYYNSVSFWWNFNFQTTSGFNGYNDQFGAINTQFAAVGLILIPAVGLLGKKAFSGEKE